MYNTSLPEGKRGHQSDRLHIHCSTGRVWSMVQISIALHLQAVGLCLPGETDSLKWALKLLRLGNLQGETSSLPHSTLQGLHFKYCFEKQKPKVQWKPTEPTYQILLTSLLKTAPVPSMSPLLPLYSPFKTLLTILVNSCPHQKP